VSLCQNHFTTLQAWLRVRSAALEGTPLGGALSQCRERSAMGLSRGTETALRVAPSGPRPSLCDSCDASDGVHQSIWEYVLEIRFHFMANRSAILHSFVDSARIASLFVELQHRAGP
jgi:hypothetical protein